MTKQARNPQETKQKILVAALNEFTQYGFHGARVDRIVKAAGVNKRMVYHYFSDKEGLFKALMSKELSKIKLVENRQPVDSLSELTLHWLKHQDMTKDYFQLITSTESLPADHSISLDEEHSDNFVDTVATLKRLLHRQDISPEYALLAMISLTALPQVLPKLAEYVTGDQPGTHTFNQEYAKVLEMLLSPTP